MKNPIPSDWDGVSWCCWAIEWPDSVLWEGLLAGLVTSPMRGRYWDEKTGSVTAAQETGQQIWLKNIPLQESLMSCSDATNLSDAIRYLADRLYAKQCCGTAGTAGGIMGTTPGGLISYGDIPGMEIVDNEAEPVPNGFESWAAYRLYKCQVSNLLADGLIASLRNISLLSLTNLSGLAILIGAALGGFIVVPPAAIAVMITALIALGLTIGVLKEVGDWLAANRDDLVCTLYLSESTVAAQDGFAGLIDEALAALVVASELHPAIRTIALVLASTDTLNQLFDASLTATYPDADCSNCGQGPYQILIYNSSDELIDTIQWDGEETSFTVDYTIASNYSPFYFHFKDLEENWICSSWTIISFPHMAGQQQNAGCGQGGTLSNVSGAGPHSGDGGRLFGTPISATGTAEISVTMIV